MFVTSDQMATGGVPPRWFPSDERRRSVSVEPPSLLARTARTYRQKADRIADLWVLSLGSASTVHAPKLLEWTGWVPSRGRSAERIPYLKSLGLDWHLAPRCGRNFWNPMWTLLRLEDAIKITPLLGAKRQIRICEDCERGPWGNYRGEDVVAFLDQGIPSDPRKHWTAKSPRYA